jgi:DNA replication regulator DPB11
LCYQESYRLPLFSDVHVCCTGIDDIQRRAQISREVTRRGGFYYKALERPVRVTHLLCSGDDATEKMMYAEKFNQRREADIKIVWEEWFWDSIEFGGMATSLGNLTRNSN